MVGEIKFRVSKYLTAFVVLLLSHYTLAAPNERYIVKFKSGRGPAVAAECV